MLLANLKNFLEEYKVKADVDIDAIPALEARGTTCDIVVTEPTFEYLLDSVNSRKAIIVDDFSNWDKLKNELLNALKELKIPLEAC